MDRLPLDLIAGLPAVLAAAEEGSATKAAARLSTTTATVLRRVANVEEVVGVRLFDRLPTGLVPTRALAALLPWIEQFAASIDGMRRDAEGLDLAPSGVVRVAAPPTIASHLLVPRCVHRLREKHPDITLEIDPGTALVDLAQREADLAIRVVKPVEGDLVFRKLTGYRMVVASAPSLVDIAQNELAELPWLSWARRMEHIPEARWLAGTFPDARVVLVASELNTLLRAARAGVGALLVAEATAAMEGGLVRLPLEGVPVPAGHLWLVAHRALRSIPRVAAVWEWIEEYFAGEPPPELTLPAAW